MSGKLLKPKLPKVEANNSVGVHAVTDAKTLRDNLHVLTTLKRDDPTLVVGEVMLWGDLAEHENGYRAANGYPITLYANTPKAQVELRDLYECNVSRRFASNVLA